MCAAQFDATKLAVEQWYYCIYVKLGLGALEEVDTLCH